MSYYIGLSVLSNNMIGHRERQKLLSAEARRVLSQLAGRPIAEDDIAREERGRPFLLNREVRENDIDFNISHSGILTAVSLVDRKKLRTGCDVELVRKRKMIREIAEEFFSVSERDYISPQGSFDETRFYQIWTLKECFIKLRGLSVFDMPEVPSFICDGNFAFNAPDFPLTFYLYELNDADERYILAAAIEGTGAEPPAIKWFSQVSLSCRSIAKINAPLNPADTVSPKI